MMHPRFNLHDKIPKSTESMAMIQICNAALQDKGDGSKIEPARVNFLFSESLSLYDASTCEFS